MRQMLAVLLLCCCVTRASDLVDYNADNRRGPLDEVPPQVAFAEGKLSLVLDPQGAVGGVVPLYIVNDTAGPASFMSPHEFFVRETLGSDGVWRRATRYRRPDCGMPDVNEIPSLGYYLIHLRLNSAIGQPEKVRVRLYNPLAAPAKVWISNEITALVDPAEVEACRYDAIAVRTGPIKDAVTVILGKVKDQSGVDERDHLRGMAIWRLMNMGDLEPLKEVISLAKTEGNREAFREILHALLLMDRSHKEVHPFWTIASNEVTSGVEPWAGEALAAIEKASVSYQDHPEPAARKRALLESILEDSKHALLLEALGVYARDAGGAEGKARLQGIARSRSYPAAARAEARRLLGGKASR